MSKITSLTFYKDNKISGKFEKEILEILKEFNETEESKLDVPFERKFLTFIMLYGSFDIITDEEWEAIYEAKRIKFDHT